jgi:hypothetical protein
VAVGACMSSMQSHHELWLAPSEQSTLLDGLHVQMPVQAMQTGRSPRDHGVRCCNRSAATSRQDMCSCAPEHTAADGLWVDVEHRLITGLLALEMKLHMRLHCCQQALQRARTGAGRAESAQCMRTAKAVTQQGRDAAGGGQGTHSTSHLGHLIDGTIGAQVHDAVPELLHALVALHHQHGHRT